MQTEFEQNAVRVAEIESRGEYIERCAVISEALSWIGTAFHMNAQVKRNGADKGGVDCGRFLIGVYSAAGMMPRYQPRIFSGQWHLHNPKGPEQYLDELQKFARKVEAPEVADIVVFHLGRHYAHAGIVLEWPARIIHAPSGEVPGGVQISDASLDAFLLRGGRKFPPVFLSPWTA